MLQIVATTDDPAPVPTPEPEITFDDIWLLHPRHVAKKDAARAFEKLPKSQRVDLAVGLAAWRKVWLDRGEMEYVPHLATFINGERFYDELPPGYTLYPRPASIAAPSLAPPINGERQPIPEHVKAILAKLREKK